jgi:hypothetical protein
MRRAFRDANAVADVAQAHARIVGDRNQYARVGGEESPTS